MLRIVSAFAGKQNPGPPKPKTKATIALIRGRLRGPTLPVQNVFRELNKRECDPILRRTILLWRVCPPPHTLYHIRVPAFDKSIVRSSLFSVLANDRTIGLACLTRLDTIGVDRTALSLRCLSALLKTGYANTTIAETRPAVDRRMRSGRLPR